jgi:hypothetical protein
MNPSPANSEERHRPSAGFDRSTIDSLVSQCAPNQLALLRLLAVADQHRMELLPLLCSFGMELSTFDRARVSKFSGQVESGTPYIEALTRTQEILPNDCVLALQLAEQENILPQFFTAILEHSTSIQLQSYNPAESESARIIRLIFRILLIGILFTFFSLTIIPELEMIIQEYGVEPPKSLLWLTEFSNYARSFFWIAAPILFLISLPFWFSLGRAYLRTWNPMRWRKPVYSSQTKTRTTLALLNSRRQNDPLGSNSLLAISDRVSPEIAELISGMPLNSNSWKDCQNEDKLSKQEFDALQMTTQQTMQSWLLRWSGKQIQLRMDRRRSITIQTLITTIDICIAVIIIAFVNTIFLYYLEMLAAMG